MVVYILRKFNQFISAKFNNKNNEEKRGGATLTGVSQKYLQIGNTNNGKKELETLAEKGRAHCKLELGGGGEAIHTKVW